MKKTTKLEKRRKTVLGAVLGVGSVALLTTATATYIISISNPTTDLTGIGVTVDTVKQDFVQIEFADINDNSGTDASIVLAETAEVSNDNYAVEWSQGDVGVGDLKIIIPKFTITYGTGWVPSASHFAGVRFSLDPAKGNNSLNLVGVGSGLDRTTNSANRGTSVSYEANETANVGSKITSAASTDEWGTTTLTAGYYWTYVDVPAALGSSGNGISSVTNPDDTVTVTYANQEVEFKWGTFFNGMSPAAFYNSIYTKDTDVESNKTELTLDIARNIAREIEDMGSALNSKNLVLTMEAYYEGDA